MTHVYVPTSSSWLRVPTAADLPASATDGDLAVTLDNGNLYEYNLALPGWQLIGSASSVSGVTDSDSVDLTVAAGILTADVRISSNAADASNVRVPINIESTGVVGLRAQIPNSSITGLISVTDTDSIDLTYTTGAISGVVRLSANAADANNTIVALDVQSAGSLGVRAQILNSNIRGLFSGTAPVTYNSTTGAIGITQATTGTDGYLSSTDWNTFNGKQQAISIGALGAGNANGLSLSTGTLTLHAATATQPGAVSTAAQTLAGDKTFSGFVAVRDLRLNDADASNYILLNSPAVVGTNYTLTLPADGGTSGYILSTNGSGTTSWVSGPSTVQLLSGSAGNLTTGTVTFSTNSDAFGFIVEFSTERAAIYCSAGYAGTGITVTSDVGGYFLASDAGTGVYIFKSATTNIISIKNRLGGTRTIKVTIITNGVATLSAFT